MRKLMLVCLATFAISGCALKRDVSLISPQTPTLCSSFFIIHPSRSDTTDTKRQVLAHNRIYRATCPSEG